MTNSKFIADMRHYIEKHKDELDVEVCATVMIAVMLEQIANKLDLIESEL